MEDNLGARITLLLALCFGMSFHPSVAWSQSAAQAPDVNAIGKVLTAEGVVRVEHPAAILVQGNLSTGEQTKVGDQIYRGDIIQTGPDGKLSAALADGSSFSVSPMRAWKSTNSCMILMVIPMRA